MHIDIDNLNGCKINLTEENSERIQLRLFELGLSWVNSKSKVTNARGDVGIESGRVFLLYHSRRDFMEIKEGDLYPLKASIKSSRMFDYIQFSCSNCSTCTVCSIFPCANPILSKLSPKERIEILRQERTHFIDWLFETPSPNIPTLFEEDEGMTQLRPPTTWRIKPIVEDLKQGTISQEAFDRTAFYRVHPIENSWPLAKNKTEEEPNAVKLMLEYMNYKELTTKISFRKDNYGTLEEEENLLENRYK